MATAKGPIWVVVSDNGDYATCCFCTVEDLRKKQHFIPECQKVWKTGYEEYGKMLNHTGPPICHCARSKKFPICPAHQMVCGHNIHCPDNIYGNSCHIEGLIPKRTMKCNNYLNWEYDFPCEEACEPTFEIKNGTVRCDNIMGPTNCNFSCNAGYEATRTTNFTCAEAKNATCFLSEKPTSTSAVLIGVPIVIVLAILAIIAIYFLYKKYKSSRPSRQHVNGDAVPLTVIHSPIQTGENGVIANGNIPNGGITNGGIPNGGIPNGVIANGNIVRDTHTNPQDYGNQEGDDSSRVHESDNSNHNPESEDNYPTPEELNNASTFNVRGINNPEDPRSLLYHDSLPCLPRQDSLGSLQNLAGNQTHGNDDDDLSETPPKSLIESEIEPTETEPFLAYENLVVPIEETGLPSDEYHLPIEETCDHTYD